MHVQRGRDADTRRDEYDQAPGEQLEMSADTPLVAARACEPGYHVTGAESRSVRRRVVQRSGADWCRHGSVTSLRTSRCGEQHDGGRYVTSASHRLRPFGIASFGGRLTGGRAIRLEPSLKSSGSAMIRAIALPRSAAATAPRATGAANTEIT